MVGILDCALLRGKTGTPFDSILILMADRPDKDQIDDEPTRPEPPRVSTSPGASFPTEEPNEQSLSDQREIIVGQVKELEGAVQYMGSGHPQREELRTRLKRLKEMLKRMDEMSSAAGK